MPRCARSIGRKMFSRSWSWHFIAAWHGPCAPPKSNASSASLRHARARRDALQWAANDLEKRRTIQMHRSMKLNKLIPYGPKNYKAIYFDENLKTLSY